jgi:flagellar hook-basal body complex protein FliE
MALPTLPAVVTADLKPLDGARPLAPERGEGGGSFADALGQALQSVDRLQVDADRDAQAVALGGGNLHETALALEKADVAMKLAVKVRNKVVEAYQDVMRMSV